MLTDNAYARTGLFLLPIGILNETHEPDTFYGVERNDVESIIIPSTWWEAGAGLNSRFANGLSWDLGAIYYSYPGVSGSLNYDFWEVAASLGYDFGVAAVTGSVNYSPEFFGKSGTAWYPKLAVDVPELPAFSPDVEMEIVALHWGMDWSLGPISLVGESQLQRRRFPASDGEAEWGVEARAQLLWRIGSWDYTGR